MKWHYFFLIFIFLKLPAQEGFHLVEDKKTVIPFQFINNLIFIPVNINGVELTFLLDSGVSETLLFSLDNKQINFNQVEKMKFSGLGGSVEVEGLKSQNNIVSVGDNYKDYSHQIYIILNEDFNFSSHIGIPVNGIIGYQFFKNHKIKIDYSTHKITVFHNAKTFERATKRSDAIPISIELNKPYLTAGVEQINSNIPSKMLIDLGNSDAVWLFPKLIDGFVYNRPNIEDFLGRGFNGDIYGKRSRIHNIYLASFKIEKPLTAMPDEYSIQHLRLVDGRKGSIGGEILRRFTVVFDYPDEKIFIKKNKFFNDPFHFNMGGLDVKHDGMVWEKELVKIQTTNNEAERGTNLTQVYNAKSEFQYRFVLKQEYSVAGSRTDSPAYLSGVRTGDKILTINKKKASDMSLKEINELLKSEEGKLIIMEIERNDMVLTYSFNLEDPIPYQEP